MLLPYMMKVTAVGGIEVWLILLFSPNFICILAILDNVDNFILPNWCIGWFAKFTYLPNLCHLQNYIYSINDIITVAPTITTPMEGEEFNITEGSNRSITCTATGYPVPTVVWQNSDGSSLSNNRLVSGSPVISSTGVGNVSSVSVELMVIGAIRVDSGMYRCSANNSVNSITTNITITVYCKHLKYIRVIIAIIIPKFYSYQNSIML